MRSALVQVRNLEEHHKWKEEEDELDYSESDQPKLKFTFF